jgi:hypothetical protein
MPAPMGIQYPLLMKVFSADRNLSARSGNGIVIGVIYQRNVRESARAAHSLEEWVRRNPDSPFAGTEVHLVALAIDELSDLGQALTRDSVDICYIAPLRASSLDTLLSVTRRLSLATCTGVPEYVEQGVSVGVGVKADHPQILINMFATKLETLELGSEVLTLARIYAKE